MIVGIMGGIASGKSFVSRALVRLGAAALDADRAGHEVLDDAEVKQAIRNKWGDSVFQADGRIDRSAVAQLVFGPAAKGAENLAFLESITHPLIGERLRRQAERLAEQGTKIIVLDAALLLKAGWDQFCDCLVFVDAPLEVRRQRAAERGWEAEDLDRREAAQIPVQEKKSRADFVIDNGGTEQQTLAQIRRLWRLLQERAGC
jgi:dephospho-CoA kinase